MEGRKVTEILLTAYEQHVREDEKSKATIQKYVHDIKCFVQYAGGQEVNKTLTLAYKEKLKNDYAISSANSMIAALNSFLRFLGWHDCTVKQFKVQKKIYASEETELTRAEYNRLVRTAERKGNDRLALLIQTICGTGIRVSELEYITVEAVRKGEADVDCKGKRRTVFIVNDLRYKLLRYIKKKNLSEGAVFVTKHGRPINRSNIWREMKALCEEADVASSKVFPHNLRHLFARVFYAFEKDIAKLADILGHASINTTRVYIITTGAEHRRKMEQMKLIL